MRRVFFEMKLLQTLSHTELLENARCHGFAKILNVYFESTNMLLTDSLSINLSNHSKGTKEYRIKHLWKKKFKIKWSVVCTSGLLETWTVKSHAIWFDWAIFLSRFDTAIYYVPLIGVNQEGKRIINADCKIRYTSAIAEVPWGFYMTSHFWGETTRLLL